jgi:hypothetical protein
VAAYEPLLGKEVGGYKGQIHQVLPQCSLFLCGTIYKDLVDFQKKDSSEIPKVLQKEGGTLIQTHLLNILNYAQNNKTRADKSWPVLLKSNAFFNYMCAYMEGIHSGNGSSKSVQSK